MVLKTSSRSLRPSRDLLIRQLLEVEIVQGGHLRLQAARPDVLAPRNARKAQMGNMEVEP